MHQIKKGHIERGRSYEIIRLRVTMINRSLRDVPHFVGDVSFLQNANRRKFIGFVADTSFDKSENQIRRWACGGKKRSADIKAEKKGNRLITSHL